MGALPQVFEGKREEADDFIDAVRNHFRLNHAYQPYQSYRTRIAWVITLLHGPNVAPWAREQGEWLDDFQGPDDLDLWNQFLDQFRAYFQDTQKDQRAVTEIERLRMKWPDIDGYTSRFVTLAREANYDVGEPAVVKLYLNGLPKSIIPKLAESGVVGRGFAAIREKAVQLVTAQQLVNAIMENRGEKGQNAPRSNQQFNAYMRGNQQNRGQNNQNRGQYRPQYNSSNAPRNYNDQRGVPMDVDRTQMRRNNNNRGGYQGNRNTYDNQYRGQRMQNNVVSMDGQRQQRAQNGECFNCGGQGHFARNCPKKRQGQHINMAMFEDNTQNMVEQPEPAQSSSNSDRLNDIYSQIRGMEPDEAQALAGMLGQGGGGEDFTTA